MSSARLYRVTFPSKQREVTPKNYRLVNEKGKYILFDHIVDAFAIEPPT